MEKRRNLKQILDDFVRAFPQEGETYEDVTALLVKLDEELENQTQQRR